MSAVTELISGVLVFILIAFIIIELHWRNQPNYVASLKIPGEYMYPLIGNLSEVIFVNSGTFHLQSNCKINK